MKTLKEYIVEAKSDIDFDDFYYALRDKAYDLGDWGGGLSSNIIRMKTIFGKDTITCTATGEDGRGTIIRFAAPESVDYIYTYFGKKKYVGVHCINKSGNMYRHMYLTNREQLKKCFGEENLEKIYKFIKN
jgi:hypothetical protein